MPRWLGERTYSLDFVVGLVWQFWNLDRDLPVGLLNRSLNLGVEPGHVVLNLSAVRRAHQGYVDLLEHQ